MMGSFMGIVNQYIKLVQVLYCKLPTNGKQLPIIPCNRYQKFKRLILYLYVTKTLIDHLDNSMLVLKHKFFISKLLFASPYCEKTIILTSICLHIPRYIMYKHLYHICL